MAETGKFLRTIDEELNKCGENAGVSKSLKITSTKLCSGDTNRALELSV